METTVFDDGSTLTWANDYSYVAATESPFTNMPSASWAPSAVNPGAKSWDDVLKFGLARVIDAKTRPLYPENTLPLYQQQRAAQQAGGDALIWLLLAGVAVYALG